MSLFNVRHVKDPVVRQILEQFARQFPLQTQNYADESIDADKIKPPLGPSLLDVEELSEIASDLGTITAGLLIAVSLLTQEADPHVSFDAVDGIQMTDAEGNVLVSLPADGSTPSFTGDLGTVKGGIGEIEFDGVATSAGVQLEHGLPDIPTAVVVNFTDVLYVPGTDVYSKTKFFAGGETNDKSVPAAGTKAVFHWIATTN